MATAAETIDAASEVSSAKPTSIESGTRLSSGKAPIAVNGLCTAAAIGSGNQVIVNPTTINPSPTPAGAIGANAIEAVNVGHGVDSTIELSAESLEATTEAPGIAKHIYKDSGTRHTAVEDPHHPAKATSTRDANYFDAPAVASFDSGDAQATDTFAAEVLDATDGAFTTVAKAIEVGIDPMTPSGFDSYVSTADSTVRKPGFQTASKAPLDIHIQAPTLATAKDLDYNASTADSTVKCAGSASSVGGQCVQAPALATASSLHGSTTQPDTPALESGSRPSTVSTPRRDTHPFLTTENALVGDVTQQKLSLIHI